ncbi:CBS domain-containing protein [Halobaculum sp. P14]|uniref:CBS domain-containing protein n=1 Tax=Halobaculum sp. P14 TaxID=3421638 RepID=UPI003EBBCBB0
MPVHHLAVEPVTASPDDSVESVAETMAEDGIGDVVVTENESPVGVLTDRDVAVAYGNGRNLDELEAADVMSENPVTIEGDAEAVDLPKRMAEAGVRRLPVVDDHGDIEGVVTLDDVVAVVGEELEDVATVIESQSPGYSP